VLSSGAGAAAYAASKRGVSLLTEALAEELKERGITVNVVLPKLIDTAANRAAGLTKGAVAPEDIAKVIVFLCSDAARIVTGAAIPV
jgi:NAD(P)-dependent dehydrogenase (short-subunit alcohol dehydrogenase family)